MTEFHELILENRHLRRKLQEIEETALEMIELLDEALTDDDEEPTLDVGDGDEASGC